MILFKFFKYTLIRTSQGLLLKQFYIFLWKIVFNWVLNKTIETLSYLCTIIITKNRFLTWINLWWITLLLFGSLMFKCFLVSFACDKFELTWKLTYWYSCQISLLIETISKWIYTIRKLDYSLIFIFLLLYWRKDMRQCRTSFKLLIEWITILLIDFLFQLINFTFL